MLRQKNRYLAVILLLQAGTPVLAADTEADAYVSRAIQLLRATYPELKNVCPTITDQVELSERPLAQPAPVSRFTISLYYCHLHPLDPRYKASSEPMLSGLFSFLPKYNSLRFLWLSGPLVMDRLEKLEAEVEKHPGWSDAQIIEAMKAAGARFGPGDRAEFMRKIPLRELAVVAGHLEVASADLGVRHRPPVLRWRVEAKWHSDDGRYEADYLLFFEPFEGRLLDFSLRSDIRPAQ